MTMAQRHVVVTAIGRAIAKNHGRNEGKIEGTMFERTFSVVDGKIEVIAG